MGGKPHGFLFCFERNDSGASGSGDIQEGLKGGGSSRILWRRDEKKKSSPTRGADGCAVTFLTGGWCLQDDRIHTS